MTTTSCECKKWTRGEYAFWAHWPDGHGHHPACPSYKPPGVEHLREALGRHMASEMRASPAETLWSDPQMLDWDDLAEHERKILCDMAQALARIGQSIEIERRREEDQSRIELREEPSRVVSCAEAAKAIENCRIMGETLRRAQARGTELLERARQAEQQRDDALGEIARLKGSPAPNATRCTGVAAVWCPVHGTCNCPRDDNTGAPIWDGNGEVVYDHRCALHGDTSTHGKEPEEDPGCVCRACCGATGDQYCSCR